MRKGLGKRKIIRVAIKCNGECRDCQSKEDLDIHHIDLNHENDNEDNLILLCELCHDRLHKKYGNYKYYDEERIKGYLENYPDEYDFKEGSSWICYVDGTDHFAFFCPTCNGPAIVSKVQLIDDGINGRRICPTFLFKLKCNKCKLKGQRKCYLNSDLLEYHNKQWKKQHTYLYKEEVKENANNL